MEKCVIKYILIPLLNSNDLLSLCETNHTLRHWLWESIVPLIQWKWAEIPWGELPQYLYPLYRNHIVNIFLRHPSEAIGLMPTRLHTVKLVFYYHESHNFARLHLSRLPDTIQILDLMATPHFQLIVDHLPRNLTSLSAEYCRFSVHDGSFDSLHFLSMMCCKGWNFKYCHNLRFLTINGNRDVACCELPHSLTHLIWRDCFSDIILSHMEQLATLEVDGLGTVYPLPHSLTDLRLHTERVNGHGFVFHKGFSFPPHLKRLSITRILHECVCPPITIPLLPSEMIYLKTMDVTLTNVPPLLQSVVPEFIDGAMEWSAK